MDDCKVPFLAGLGIITDQHTYDQYHGKSVGRDLPLISYYANFDTIVPSSNYSDFYVKYQIGNTYNLVQEPQMYFRC